jgi:protein involved in polysaccharide export with SLBB domain
MGLLLLFSSLAAAQYTQMPSQGGNLGGTQSQSGADCLDPAMANSSQCSGQAASGSVSAQGSQSSNATSNRVSDPLRSPGAIYSDLEQYSQPTLPQSSSQEAPLPPEPLSEFQKFVASATGQVLPIYGASLFGAVPSTYAPLNLAPVPPDFVIGPGDELRLRVWGQINFQANLRVDRSGEIFLPQIGPTHVAGMPFSALDAHLRSAIGRLYHNFDLTADVGQIRSIQVYLSGEARHPGVYTVSSLSSLVDALFVSGGPSVHGSLRHIQLRRDSAVVADLDLYDLLIHGDKSKDVKLQSGDVIFIPPAGPQVAVTGSVNNPAIYEFRAGESLAALLANAGGATSGASESRISIDRIEDHRNRQAMEVDYDAAGLATPLTDGDLVRVYSLAPIYRKTIILRGNTANPGRFAWHPGMRLSDLIPDKESLITRNYWWKRAQLGLPEAEFEPAQGLDKLLQPADNHATSLSAANAVNAANLAGTHTANPSSTPPEQSAAPQSQPVAQNNQSLNAQQRAGNSTLAAEQEYLPARNPSMAPRTEVRSLAPEIDWSYAVIERQDSTTLKSTLIPFDLGKLVLQHDAAQNLELLAGDVVTIFSEADINVPIAQQTKMVTLGGEFNHAGVYTVQPGETLRQLVERAGGFTSSAYLYGSEFTRESTRVVQQARIDEYIQSLSMRIERGNLSLASAAVSTADLASSSAAQNSERDLLASLRQIRATGRIVLRFAPDSSSFSSLPDITLEDGDHFVIPPVPATVNVVGAVFDQNSFLFTPSGRVTTYLQMAGGPNGDADRRHEFVIRADGEVVSRERGNSLWSGSEFSRVRINPGDTIVIPERTFRPSALRGLLDWSQVFSQFALGAAAIQVLK